MRKIVEATVLVLCFISAILIATTPAKCQTYNPVRAAATTADQQLDVETSPQVYYAGEYMILSQPDGCGASACQYTLNVYTDNGMTIVAQFLNTYATVKSPAANVWELTETADFMFLADIPHVYGPSIPIAICKWLTDYVDCTQRELLGEAKSRRDELLTQTAACRAKKSCMDDMQTKAHIVELAIYQVIFTQNNGVFDMPNSWLGGMSNKEFKALVVDIMARNFARLGSHVPAK